MHQQENVNEFDSELRFYKENSLPIIDIITHKNDASGLVDGLVYRIDTNYSILTILISTKKNKKYLLVEKLIHRYGHLLGKPGITLIDIGSYLRQHVDVVKDETVPSRLVYQRLEEAYVKQHGPIELELSAWLDQIHAVVDRLLREEAVHVQEKEVAISQPISIGHDDRYSE